MNRREAITGTLAAVVSPPLVAQEKHKEDGREFIRSLWSANRYSEQKTLSTVAVVDDPDVEQIAISVLLKKGVLVPGLDSFVQERALLKHVGDNLIFWLKHCRDTGMKTL